VRALLSRPDVLIVDHLADGWRSDEQNELIVTLMRGFIDGSLDACIAPEGLTGHLQKRTVLWSMQPNVFRRALLPFAQPGDLLLTLHSSEVATLAPFTNTCGKRLAAAASAI
jgi:hypothetical protein